MKAGERINGRYKIRNIIGSGGMAQVYLATDLILDRDVAVKTLAYNFQDDEDSLRRFKREAMATTELVHPNIVNIYDVEEDGLPYIVMEYVKGMDLKDYILKNNPIPYKKTVSIMQQILDAVSYAHENNIIHRDIKPKNILIDENDTIKITDFGIAVALSQNSITQTNSLLGSVHYMSPEQARGSMVTKSSDIYSLGIVLYEMLTGDVPFKGESAVSIALKHFQSPLPSIREKDHSLPQSLENVVLKATAKDAIQRYKSVREMKEDLQTALLPERSNEEKFVPRDINEDSTKMLTPVSETEATTENKAVKIDDIEDSTPNEKLKKKRRWPWIITLLVLFLFLPLGYFMVQSAPSEIQLPEFQGLSLEEARTQLEENNLMLGDVVRRSNEEVEEGVIIDSNPTSGTTIREEQDIDFYVSTGKQEYELEDYEDEDFEEIRAELTEMGFTVEREEQSSDAIEQGNIVSQDVPAGEAVIPNETTITFTVSTGPAGFPLRDLTEYSRAGVDDYVQQYGLNVTIEEAPSEDVPEGQVMSQQPEPGTTLYSNSHITVTFSAGPEETALQHFSNLVTIPYEETTNENQESGSKEGAQDEEENAQNEAENSEQTETEPNHVQIFISDAETDMDEPVHEFDMTEETQLILNFAVEDGNTAEYRIVRDGEVIEEETVES